MFLEIAINNIVYMSVLIKYNYQTLNVETSGQLSL